MQTKLSKIALICVGLTFIVIVLGAYTRLKDAGLGCPDWPGCYGKFFAPAADEKAWTEMVHRYVASSLGLLIIYLAIKTINLHKHFPKLWIAAILVLALVIFQGLLGMWTVTLGLYPIIVMGHLLGGFGLLASLWLLYLQLNRTTILTPRIKLQPYMKSLAGLTLLALIVQIALGGWTSANYAALVCADFPTCQGYIWPQMEWLNAFDFISVGIFDSPGVALENTARVTIQMAHRLGALCVAVLSSILIVQLYRTKITILTRLAKLLAIFLTIQITLGILNVLAELPLVISLLHSAIAALLLICLVTITYILYAKTNTSA